MMQQIASELKTIKFVSPGQVQLSSLYHLSFVQNADVQPSSWGSRKSDSKAKA